MTNTETPALREDLAYTYATRVAEYLATPDGVLTLKDALRHWDGKTSAALCAVTMSVTRVRRYEALEQIVDVITRHENFHALRDQISAARHSYFYPYGLGAQA